MRERGWAVKVAFGETGPLIDDVRAAGVDVARIDVGIPRRVFRRADWLAYFFVTLPRSIWQTRRLARHADLVHLNSSAMIGALVGARLARRPVILHLRESWSHQARAWAVYGRLIGRLAAAVIANSAAVGAELAALGHGDMVTVVHNGIPFRPRRTATPEPNSVVMVGRINEGKGQQVLVDAIALLRDRGTPVTATIAGDVFPGGERFLDELNAAIDARGVRDSVRLPGFVEDVDSLVAAHEIFVLPSVRPEGFGLVLIEAMAQGRPCIASNAGGPREIVLDGRTGILVPPGDAVALADAISRLLADPEERRRLGDAADADVRERFSADRTVNGVEAVYDRVLPTGDRGA